MNICIWCNKPDIETTFNTKAHIVPKSLGGKLICNNVCDKCNNYFGSYQDKYPPIEETIKETFSISRTTFLFHFNELGKNKGLDRHTSRYFNINFKERTFKIKQSYNFQKNFQEKLSRQLIRGMYKMYLESLEFSHKNALNNQFDFIREFSRYNIGDYPLFYFQRKMGAILVGKSLVIDPDLNLNPNTMSKYLIDDPNFFEFDFLGHVFSIARNRNWHLDFKNYALESFKAKSSLFKGCITVKRFDDIDFALNILQD